MKAEIYITLETETEYCMMMKTMDLPSIPRRGDVFEVGGLQLPATEVIVVLEVQESFMAVSLEHSLVKDMDLSVREAELCGFDVIEVGKLP